MLYQSPYSILEIYGFIIYKYCLNLRLFPIILRFTRMLGSPDMRSAITHCVALLLVSNATASTCAVIGNMSTGWTSFSS